MLSVKLIYSDWPPVIIQIISFPPSCFYLHVIGFRTADFSCQSGERSGDFIAGQLPLQRDFKNQQNTDSYLLIYQENVQMSGIPLLLDVVV